MRLYDIYQKAIDREITGVIKVGQDDNKNVLQELEEYVLTDELSQHFDTFFENYKKGIVANTDKMGVWISGFFGSGKSHFLKILSYLLENKEIEGKRAIDFFETKIKDPMVLADMQKAGNTSTDVILFNIDSKSESNYKTSKDAILKVFNKVFDEMQGYCGVLPWVADLERQMVKEGVYDKFKRVFKEESGYEWEKSREDIFYEGDAVVAALNKARGMSEEAANNWLEKADGNYSLSIEKFAKKVNEYIESKGHNHHVVFLVDEIGQYIGDNSGLMLNLQTVVEDLGIYCSGKCWVLVTSQQDIDTLTKGQVRGNDFSKIQGRFNTRLSLSSSNVDEVIKKRLLSKTDGAKQTLEIMYSNKESILKNIINFTIDTAEMKNYQDSKDFIETYPFIPYQFNLLQKVFEGVRQHGASGKHISEGERSLLGAFQESAIRYKDYELGTLIPFHVFYETIENFLDGNIKSVISKAKDNNRLNDYDVDVLKVLFLLKYVKEVKPNLENISILMLSNIDDDKIEIKRKIQESVNKLIRETLVQKNGDEYEFLTNDEQDINKEIQNMQVEIGEIIEKVKEIVFGDIYRTTKFRYSSKKDFSFNKYIDESPHGIANNEVGVKLITPHYDIDDMTPYDLKQLSIRENNVIIKLSNEMSYLEEIEEALKIEKYLRLNSGSKSNSTVESIKDRKGTEKIERRERAVLLLKENIKTAEIYINGSLMDIKEKEAENRINEGLKILIDTVYNKFSYIKKNINSNKELVELLSNRKNEQISIDGFDEDENKLAIDEVFRYIERYSIGTSITIKTILLSFSKAPYGWDDLDIQGIIAKLFKSQKIKLECSGENITLDNRDVVNYITKRDYVEKTKVKVRKGVPNKYIKDAKEISKDVFYHTITESDEDGVMANFKNKAKDVIYEIDRLLDEYKFGRYPDKKILEQGKKLIEDSIYYKEPLEFFKNISDLYDDFQDYGDDSEEIRKFFKKDNGKDSIQKVNFDKGLKTIKHAEENMDYLDDATKSIVDNIKQIAEMDKPYNKIHELPMMIEKYNDKLIELYENEAKNIEPILKNHKAEVIDYLNQFDFRDEFKSEYIKKFDDLINKLQNAKQFNEILAMPQISKRTKENCISEIDKEQEKRNKESKTNGGDGADIIKDPPVVKEIRKVYKSNLISENSIISSQEDIDRLLNDLKNKLEKELEQSGKFKLV